MAIENAMTVFDVRDPARSLFWPSVFIRPQVVQDQTPDRDDQFGWFHRFGHMRLEAGFEHAYAVLGAGERCQRDGWQCAMPLPLLPFAQFTDQAYAVLARHGNVGDEDVRSWACVIREQVERFTRGAERSHPS